MEYTLSFSESSKGWTSFYSFIPEMMIGMNSYFYTFKNGNLYRHNTNEIRNKFYEDLPASSKITGVFNIEPSTVKNFNTFVTNNDGPWSIKAFTDLSTGYIDPSYFESKEGNYFAYLRRYPDDNNLDLRSSQGIGTPTTIDQSVPSLVIVTFNYNLGSIVSIGDMAYRNYLGSPEKLGKIVGVSGKSITIDTTVSGGNAPTVTDFILYFKNSVAESYGLRGYFMQFEMENVKTTPIQLFSVGTNIFKSFP